VGARIAEKGSITIKEEIGMRSIASPRGYLIYHVDWKSTPNHWLEAVVFH
jgi:hypothetical protein